MRSFFQAARALVVVAPLAVMLAGCGDTFRPVVIPVPVPGPDPQSQKVAVVLSTSGSAAQGSATNINLSGDTNTGQVSVGRDPVYATTYLSGTRVIVDSRLDDSLSIYTLSSPLISPAIVISLPSGAAPTFLFTTGASSELFSIFSAHESIGIVSLATSLYLNEICLGGAPVGTVCPVTGMNPVAIAGTADGNKIYVANAGNNTVSVIDARANAKLQDVTVGASPAALAISTDQKRVYVVNNGDSTVTVLDTTTELVTATIPVGPAPNSIFVDSKLLRVYVTNSGGNTVSVINSDPLTAAFHTVATVTVGTAPVAVTALADGTRAYVANSGSANVSVINTLNNAVSGTIALPAGSTPVAIASSKDSVKVAVLSQGSNTLTLIRAADNVVTLSPPVPASPVFLMVVP